MKHTVIDDNFRYLYGLGRYYRAYESFGAHPACIESSETTPNAGTDNPGVRFTVFAPHAKSVRVIGDFNDWGQPDSVLAVSSQSSGFLTNDDYGYFTGIIPGAREGSLYKYVIETKEGKLLYKADPYAFFSELRPGTASRVAFPKYRWHDDSWLANRSKTNHFRKPLNIYEVHLGSWKAPDAGSGATDSAPADYRYLAKELIPYVKDMGYTHIELMPLAEHPFDGSWGYQITGFYSVTSRYGTPEDFMYFVDECHKAKIGVIMDWVPGHFCRDAHGLVEFDGEKLYELEEHPDWGTYKFNFGSGCVRSFLLSNALFWLDIYHIDGLRVDAVSSMLYLNYGIEDKKKKRFNEDGSEENREASAFIKEFNYVVGTNYPGVMTIAEESSAWPLVTTPPDNGGLGFHYKWDMGWMNDTLDYMKQDFPYRGGCHSKLTFSMMYAFNENFVLPLSHDEVVHGKCSLIGRMPGDYWRQFAGLRLLALYQMTHPGAKLNFMGNEFGQFIEWRYYEPLEWFLLDYDTHKMHQSFVRELNRMYLRQKALWDCDHDWRGFQWLDADNSKQCILSYVRKTEKDSSELVVVLNCEVNPQEKFRLGVPRPGIYKEVFSSDEPDFGGSGKLNPMPLKAEKIPYHGQRYSIEITVPPLGGAVFKLAK